MKLPISCFRDIATLTRRRILVVEEEPCHVTITDKAFALLQKVSTRDNVTYSDTLEFYLGKAFLAKSRR